MQILLHALHLGMVVLGLVVVVWLVQPGLARRHRVRQLRAAAAAGTLVELATRQTRAGVFGLAPHRPLGVRALYAYSFAVVATATVVAATRLSGDARPQVPVLAAVAAILALAGGYLFTGRHSPIRLVLLATFAELIAHAVAVVAGNWHAYRGTGAISQAFAAALICHRSSVTPTAAQVRDFATRTGIRLPVRTGTTTSQFLSPSAFAGVAAATIACAMFAWFLDLDAAPGRASRG